MNTGKVSAWSLACLALVGISACQGKDSPLAVRCRAVGTRGPIDLTVTLSGPIKDGYDKLAEQKQKVQAVSVQNNANGMWLDIREDRVLSDGGNGPEIYVKTTTDWNSMYEKRGPAELYILVYRRTGSFHAILNGNDGTGGCEQVQYVDPPTPPPPPGPEPVPRNKF